MLKPFDYQEQALADMRSARARGKRRLLLCMLMGAGKTLTAMELMRLCSEKEMRSLFLCDRRMLTQQAVERAKDQGLDAGIILSGRGVRLDALCQFASKQTMESWLGSGKLELPEPDLVIVDEAHRATSERWVKMFERWPKATIVGLTATPCLGNGDGMGAYYDYLCQPIQPSRLKELERIVPVRAFSPHVPDLKGVKKDKDGDYSAKSLAERMTRDNLVGDVAVWWERIAANRPSVYFACDVAHALSIRDEFRAHGVTSEIICDETSDDDRDEIRDRLAAGSVKVVVNCDVLAEGVDWPFVSCIGLVRPTKRLRRYLQNAGRGMRAHPGKKDCIIIDHAGCVLYHGFPDVDRDWPLDPCDNIDKKLKEAKDGQPKQMTCAKCTANFSGSRTCPECGHVHAWVKKPKDQAKGVGTLVEVSGGDLGDDTTRLLQQRFWATCIATAIKRGRKAGMAAGMFSQKFGIPPWQAQVKPLVEGPYWQEAACDVFPGFSRGKRSRGDSFEG